MQVLVLSVDLSKYAGVVFALIPSRSHIPTPAYAKGRRVRFSQTDPRQASINVAMGMVLRRMSVEDATVHGFGSSFRDWAGNVSNFPSEYRRPLWHVVGDKAEQAYRRAGEAPHAHGSIGRLLRA
jgi:hypothetical protein